MIDYLCSILIPVCIGHSSIPCVLVGTNQGGVLAFSIDMPANKNRASKSPIIMPVGEGLLLQYTHII